jgi:undecaprenyl-diphosphatase
MFSSLPAIDTAYLIKAFFLGIIEGLTEFIPVSSTGHLILVGNWIRFESNAAKVFEVVIQFGSILAVVWIFRSRLWQLIYGTLTGVREELLFTRNLLLAFFPALVVGLIFIRAIKTLFYHPSVVAVTLILGGLIMLYVERRRPPRPGTAIDAPENSAAQASTTTYSLTQISWKQALGVGCAQCIAMIPGVSRSGATIIGGMIAGIQRKTATEFSFFLAIPTMLGATVYDLYRNMALLTSQDITGIAIGFVAAFLSALIVVRAVLRFVANHTYRSFAWYRIALGLIVALTLFY